jgi:uncharacterized membrane protein
MVTAAALRSLPVDELRERARTSSVRPGRALVTAIAWLFVAAGFLAGGSWRALVFTGISVRYGYWLGIGLTDAQITARTAAPEPPAQAGSSKL